MTARQECEVKVPESRVEPVVLMYRYVSCFFFFPSRDKHTSGMFDNKAKRKVASFVLLTCSGCFQGVGGSCDCFSRLY